MITVKDFAAQQGCGESIVYRHIRNHKEELGDRVQKQHGKTWLTDEGAEYIRSLMNQPQVTFVENDAVKEERKRWEAQAFMLQGKIDLLKEQLEEKDKKLLQLAAPEQQISALEAQNADLRADRDEWKDKATQADKTAQEASDELTKAREREKEKDTKIEKLLKRNLWQRIWNKE